MQILAAASHVLHWLDAHAGSVQAITAVIVALLTWQLVRYTKRYVRETDDALTVARDELALSRKQVADQESAAAFARAQFEQEWTPDLGIVEFRSNVAKEFRLANLARSAALVRALRIGTGGDENSPPQNIEEYPLSCLVTAGSTHDSGFITQHLAAYRGKYNPPQVGTAPWEVSISIALVYDCAGKKDILSSW